MVFGRRRTRNGRRVQAPPRDWLWSPGPAHPALVDRATWEEAQKIGERHRTSRDGAGTSVAAVRFYPTRLPLPRFYQELVRTQEVLAHKHLGIAALTKTAGDHQPSAAPGPDQLRPDDLEVQPGLQRRPAIL